MFMFNKDGLSLKAEYRCTLPSNPVRLNCQLKMFPIVNKFVPDPYYSNINWSLQWAMTNKFNFSPKMSAVEELW